MRIALVHPYAWPEVRRGAERYVDDLAAYLVQVGHEVTIVTGTHGDASIDRRPDGAVVVRRPHRAVRGARRVGAGEVETFGLPAFAPLRRASVDVVHAMTPTSALAARAAGRPTLYTVLGHPTADQIPLEPAPRLAFRAALRTATEVAVLSQASAVALAQSTGRPAVVLPPGIRTGAFPAELQPRTGPPRLLFSASLSDPRKHARLAVHAFALLLERRPAARLVLSGQGDPSALLAVAAESGDHVRAAVDAPGPGDPQEVPGRYRGASVTVLPAEHEAFGLALVESLATGTPVVCGPGGGMPEIVTPEVGRVVPSLDAAALADTMDDALALAAEPATPARCAARAAWWDWAGRVGPEHVAVYDRLAGSTERRAVRHRAALS